MATFRLRLATPPSEPRALELWLQHAAGRILFEDARGYARERIDPSLSDEARAHVEKGIDDAMYGLMMVLDGVTGILTNGQHAVMLSFAAKLVDATAPLDDDMLVELDLAKADGMCMAYHMWREGDFGVDPVVVP